MSSLPTSSAPYRDSAGATEDPSLGNAIERVYEAGQSLLVRRIDLLVEELAEHARSLLAAAGIPFAGAVVALVGWFIAVAGIIDALDGSFPRFAVEIVIGILHVGIGVALVIVARRRATAAKAAS